MAEYLVLARKYRSTTFDEVVGQEPIARTLVSAIKTGRVAHAYLFTGTRGVGKTTMARILAKALNCIESDSPTPTPCNRCDACTHIAAGDDMDTIEIDGASNRKLEETQQIISSVGYHPSRCRYKIIYIDEVHMLTKESFNALLKTLEEPPPHVKFIFATTEPEKIPATILSRCQRFDFRNIPTRLIAEHLAALCKAEKVAADPDALFRVARAGAGSMRDSLSLLDQLLSAGENLSADAVVRLLGTPPEERVLAVGTAIADGSSAGALTELAGLLEGGASLNGVVQAMSELFRDLMVAATCKADSALLELPDAQRQAVGELAKRFSVPVLVQAVAMLHSLARNVRGATSARAIVEATLVRLAEAEKFVDPAWVADRLEELASGSPAPARPAGASTAQPRQFAATSRPAAGAYQRPAPARPANGSAQPASPGPAANHAPIRPPVASAQPVAHEAPAPASPAAPAAVPKPVRPLSTAEQNQLSQDPAVRKALDLFGGTVRFERQAPADENDDEDNDG